MAGQDGKVAGRLQRKAIQVCLRLIHALVQQKPAQHCEAITPQLKTHFFKKGVILRLREGNGNPLRYPCLENPLDRGAREATVHGVTESDTTERLHFHFTFTLEFLKGFVYPLFQSTLDFSTCLSEHRSGHGANNIHGSLQPESFRGCYC